MSGAAEIAALRAENARLRAGMKAISERVDSLHLLQEMNLPIGDKWDVRTFRATLALCQRVFRATLGAKP